MQAREWDEVHSNLAEVAIQLSWEAEAACDTAHSCAHEMVKVAVGRCGQLQSTEADIIQCFIVEEEAFFK